MRQRPEMDYATFCAMAKDWACYFGLSIEDAKDAAQEAAFRAWRSGAQCPTRAQMAALAKTIVRRLIIDYRRSPAGRAEHSPYDDWQGRTVHAEASEAAQWLLEHCASELDRTTLAALVCGYSAAEQAEMWPHLFGVPNDAHNARRNLRGRLLRIAATDPAAPEDICQRRLHRAGG